MSQNLSDKHGISYIRWSTLEQGNADRSSEERQISAIENAAERLGITISQRVSDKGKSAFTGKNLSEGELGKLTRRLHARELDPEVTVLVVEELDRLSRELPGVMTAWMTPLLTSGLTIVVAQTGQVITADTMNRDFGGFVQMMSQAFSAHDFSRRQRDKGNAAWSKRRTLAAGGNLTSRHRARGWLLWNEEKRAFDVIEDRAWLVREMFALCDAGHGKATIAKIFNERAATDGRYRAFSSSKVQPAEWTATAIKRIVLDRAVCGYVQFNIAPRGHDRKIPVGVPAKIYPAIIDEDQWQRVNDAATLKRIATQGRGRSISNIFGPLAKCGSCGGTMQPLGSARWVVRKDGRKTQHYFIYCKSAKMTRGTRCTNQRGWPYAKIETPLIDTILELALDDQHFRSNDETVARLSQNLVAAQRRLDGLKQRRARLLEVIGDGGDELEISIYHRVKEEENSAAKYVKRIAADLALARGATSPASHIIRVGEVRNRMASDDAEERYQARSLVKAALAELIDEMIFHPASGYVVVTVAKRLGMLLIRPNGDADFLDFLHRTRDYTTNRSQDEIELIKAYRSRLSEHPR